MEMLHVFGYLSALVIGISLGLIGGGGSILAVPVLAYLFSISEKAATAYSLFIVGASALVGGWQQHLKGYVDWRTAIVFGFPAIIGVTLVRHYVVPAMPDVFGSITGLIGAGGGFLIIPALVILANVEMKVAVGTSLIIIAIKSLMGFFLGDALTMEIDWNFLALFTGLSFIGIFIGSYLSNFIDGKKLKKGFGYFILVMSAFIFYMEFFK